VGHALTHAEESRLLVACRASRSRSLDPAVVLAINTGLRRSELLTLRWNQIDSSGRTVKVGDSKTRAGRGRVVPLNQGATAAVAAWAALFPDRQPEHAVFPSERVGAAGDDFTAYISETDPTTSVGTLKEAWARAKRSAQVICRWHDLRHTCCTRLLEQGASLPMVGKILGWSASTTVRMSLRYGHIGQDAQRQAMATLDPPAPPKKRKPSKKKKATARKAAPRRRPRSLTTAA
jgi:integrase